MKIKRLKEILKKQNEVLWIQDRIISRLENRLYFLRKHRKIEKIIYWISIIILWWAIFLNLYSIINK